MRRADVIEERDEREAEIDPRDDPGTDRVVPKHPNPPAQHKQDTQAVEGETAQDLPPGHEMVPRGGIQG